jgi:leucyl aminopeptidase
VVPVFEGDDLADLDPIQAGTSGELARILASREFRAKPFDLAPMGFQGAARRMLCVGAGPRDKLTLDRVRKLATAGGWAARQRGGTAVAFHVRPGGRDVAADARAAAEGLVLSALGVDRYKTATRVEIAPLERVTVVAPDTGGVSAAVARGAVDGHATNLARWLSDEPGNVMTPRRLAEAAQAILADTDIAVEILDEDRIAALGMGLLSAVSQGSAEPPRLIAMRYTPSSAVVPGKVLGLVGKGVTFDTGGISIKLAEGMEKMKHDMSGGAAVIAAMSAIARIRPAVPVVAIVAGVENMPGSRALKPGDIVKSAAGKTVEVINTDAEGRLILADALWYARQQGATHLVDVATLTGACVIALGKVCSGLFGAPDHWVERVQAAAGRVGERLWRLPADDDYTDLLKSESADMLNSGGRAGGAIAGAMFLREFAAPEAWVHLDVAGTAWADDAKPWQPKGATGVTVRTLVELAATGAAGW